MTGPEFRSQLILPSDRIIVAYDGMSWPEILDTAREVGPSTGMGKANSAHVQGGSIIQ